MLDVQDWCLVRPEVGVLVSMIIQRRHSLLQAFPGVEPQFFDELLVDVNPALVFPALLFRESEKELLSIIG